MGEWRKSKLKDLGRVQTGTTPSTRVEENYGDFIPFIKPPSFQKDGTIDYSGPHLSKIGIVKGRLIPANSILMVCIGATIGKTGYVDREVSCNQQINAITLKEGLNHKFFYYLLSSKLFFNEVMSRSSQATLPMINKSKWQDIEVSYPDSLGEQKRIVHLLDTAFGEIERARGLLARNLVNAGELFESKLAESFGESAKSWPEKSLIEVNRFIDYRGKTPVKTQEGIPLITAKNVRMGYLKEEPREFIAEADYDGWMTRGIPKKGDVLFTTEAPLANVTLLNTNDKIALAQRIITMCPDRSVLSGEYLSYCLQSKVLQDRILAKGTGATVTGIKSKLLKQIPIPIAPLKAQKKIVAELDEIRTISTKLQAHYTRQLHHLTELKQSLLERAFGGEL